MAGNTIYPNASDRLKSSCIFLKELVDFFAIQKDVIILNIYQKRNTEFDKIESLSILNCIQLNFQCIIDYLIIIEKHLL
jgi:hypothetical protein